MKFLKLGPAAWVASGGIALLAALTLAPTASSASNGVGPHVLRQHNAHGTGSGAGSNSNLIDHLGPVLQTANIYAIWWGNPLAWNSNTRPGMIDFFQGLSGSSYWATAQQYMRGVTPQSVNYKASVSDPSTPPSRVSTSNIAAEVQKELSNGLPTDKNGVYFVFTSNFPVHANYCAWHSYMTTSAGQVAFAYMPNVTGISGCDAVQASNISSGTTYPDRGTLSLANVTAHEFMESITDQVLSAWYDSSGSEIGDKCAWQFDGVVPLTNGTSWILQKEWSNAKSNCTETTP